MTSLLAPRSIALVGANETSRLTMRAVQHCADFEYSGRLFAVNPKYERIGAIRCFPSLSAIGEPIDLAVVLVGRDRMRSVLEDCRASGVQAAIVVADTSGDEAAELGRELLSFSTRTGILVCGPNCLGMVNVTDRIPAYCGPIGSVVKSGGVGVISQSGGNASAFIDGAAQRNLGLSYVISSGNESCLAFADYLEYLTDDHGTQVICGYVEHIEDPARFAAAAVRAARAGKPVVVIKIGGTPQGRMAALAHTGSLSGPDELVDTLFRETGVLRANTIDTALDRSSLLALTPKSRWPRGRRLAVVTIGGGAAGILADVAVKSGLILPDVPAEMRDPIAATTGSSVTIQNPFDVPGWMLDRHPEAFSGFVKAALTSPTFDAVAMCLLPQTHLLRAARTAAQAGIQSSKPVVLACVVGTPMSPEVRALIDEGDLPVIMGIDRFIQAFRAAIEFHETEPRNPFRIHRRRHRAPVLTSTMRSLSGQLPSREAAKLLRAYGLNLVRQALAHKIDDVVRSAGRVGYPVALKLADVAHKSDVDGVRLDLRTPSEVEKAYLSLARASAERGLEGGPAVIIQKMVRDCVEIYLGVDNRDPQYPPAILIGQGGTGVELEQDIQMRFAPVNRSAARQMVRSLQGHRRLAAFRGHRRRDTSAVERAIVGLSELALDVGSNLYELDLNPLMVGYDGDGAQVVDALIVLRQSRRKYVAQ